MPGDCTLWGYLLLAFYTGPVSEWIWHDGDHKAAMKRLSGDSQKASVAISIEAT